MNRVANFDPLRAAEIARAPYALVLWSFLMLAEHERITGLVEKFERVEVAGLNVFAFHKPEKLEDAHRAIQFEAGAFGSPGEAAISANAQAMLDEAKAFARDRIA